MPFVQACCFCGLDAKSSDSQVVALYARPYHPTLDYIYVHRACGDKHNYKVDKSKIAEVRLEETKKITAPKEKKWNQNECKDFLKEFMGI